MTAEQWKSVDDYIGGNLLQPNPALRAALEANAKAGLPAIDVTPPHGKMLYILAKMQGSRRILELGTLGGYSTIWLGWALPHDGVLVSLEADPAHAKIAQGNIERAGLGQVVRILVGKALESLPKVKAGFPGPFDLVFIDADKVNTSAYFEWALRLSRPGTVIITDNVVRKGELSNPASTDASVQAMRRFVEMLANEPRVEATGIQTVSAKGYDGFVIARVK